MSGSDRIAIVAHDAGGAEVLSSHVRRQGAQYLRRCLFVLDGPARKIFEAKLGPIRNLPLGAAIGQASSVLCGTGWQSDLEVQSINIARQLNKKSTAFLDHWVNYRERFVRGETLYLPDAIWVGDPMALELARTALPEVPITFIANPYFLDIQAEFSNRMATRPPEGRFSVLYVSEPVREHALQQHGDERHWGYTEEDALRYFLDNIRVFNRPVARILIRPHPAEAVEKYFAIAGEYGLPICFSDGRELMEEIAESHCIVGCNSMAMVVGLLAGRQVVCCLPPGGRPCVLPQAEIQHLQTLAKNRTL